MSSTTSGPSLIGSLKMMLDGKMADARKSLERFLKSDKPCQNGGTRRAEICECPPLFGGQECEKIECKNGGERITTQGKAPKVTMCRCPHHEYITGRHCELVSCANGGHLLPNASCQCVDVWHAGRFCENFAPSGAIIAVPAICFLLIVLCCCICRMDLCPRRSSRPRTRNAPAPRQPRGNEYLLNQEAANQRAVVSYLPPQSTSAPYVIRLDTIPTFNPNMVGGVAIDGKVVEPPPPYEQALSAPSNLDPPRYEPPKDPS